MQTKIGIVDRSVFVFVPDPASTDGSGKTGLVAADLTVSYARMEDDNDATVTDVTSSLNDLAALTTAHTDWGLKEVSNTLQPGIYRLDVADAVFASGAWYAVVYVMITASAAAATPLQFQLVAFDPLNATSLGLSKFADIETDTQDIQGRLPAALTGDGNIKADTLRWGGTMVASANVLIDGAITAAKIASDAITAAKIQDAALTAAKFASGAFDAVWSVATRLLTAGTNIVLAKGTGVTGFNDLSAAQVNAEADTAIADAALATAANLSTVAGYLDTEIAAILADTNELQTDWANGGRLDLILDARASQASVDTVDGIVDAILVDTARVDALIEDASGDRFTAKALEEAPTGGSAPTVEEIADEVETRELTLVPAYDAAKTAATQTSVDDLPTNLLAAATLAPIAANAKQVNDVALVGDGSTTPWGPA